MPWPRGTFEFQSAYARAHLLAYARRPFVNGAILWALRDFRVTPVWNGGNPKPNPPWHNKSVIDETGAKKPAYKIVRRLFRRVKPLR